MPYIRGEKLSTFPSLNVMKRVRLVIVPNSPIFQFYMNVSSLCLVYNHPACIPHSPVTGSLPMFSNICAILIEYHFSPSLFSPCAFV